MDVVDQPYRGRGVPELQQVGHGVAGGPERELGLGAALRLLAILHEGAEVVGCVAAHVVALGEETRERIRPFARLGWQDLRRLLGDDRVPDVRHDFLLLPGPTRGRFHLLRQQAGAEELLQRLAPALAIGLEARHAVGETLVLPDIGDQPVVDHLEGEGDDAQ